MNLKTESKKNEIKHLSEICETISNGPTYMQLESHQPGLMKWDFPSSCSAAVLLVFSSFFVRTVIRIWAKRREMEGRLRIKNMGSGRQFYD